MVSQELSGRATGMGRILHSSSGNIGLYFFGS